MRNIGFMFGFNYLFYANNALTSKHRALIIFGRYKRIICCFNKDFIEIYRQDLPLYKLDQDVILYTDTSYNNERFSLPTRLEDIF